VKSDKKVEEFAEEKKIKRTKILYKDEQKQRKKQEKKREQDTAAPYLIGGGMLAAVALAGGLFMLQSSAPGAAPKRLPKQDQDVGPTDLSTQEDTTGAPSQPPAVSIPTPIRPTALYHETILGGP
jgi:hypothetical protein